MVKEYQFIELEGEIKIEERQPASYIRKSILLEKKVVKAELRITALGCYHAYMNGISLGEQLLLPGYTDYHYRVQRSHFDITGLLHLGENVIGAVVGDGWYRGALGIRSKRNCYGTKTKFSCLLHIIYEGGESEQIVTDTSWKVTQDGPLLANDLKVIEYYDAKKEMEGWNLPGYVEETHPFVKWQNATLTSYGGKVIPWQGEKLEEHEIFSPQILVTPDGNMLLDFKQNHSGHVEFTVSGHGGELVELVMGETLDEKGNFTQKNLIAEGSSAISGELGQRLVYRLKEGKQTYKSLFLISGYRYVLLKNWPEEVEEKNFKSIAVYSSMEMNGEFTCSNPLVNKLVENVRWSMKSNFVEIPMDCPTRERAGWTADISLFGETACYLANPRKFLEKWLEDYKLEQEEDGSLPFVVPQAGYSRMQRSCKGWSDAISNLAIVLYDFYGEKEILENVYDTVKRYVEYDLRRGKKRNLFFLFKRGRHRKYIIETGFHYGEWLEPGSVMAKDLLKALFYPDTEVTTAYFYQTVNQLAYMAKILGYKADIVRYETLAANIKEAYRKTFLKKGKLDSKRHCRYVRPLMTELLVGEEGADMAKKLNEKSIENNYRIATGFLTTGKLLSVLSDYGYKETAYRILENTDMPGWLYPVTKGATTTWENWYGLGDDQIPKDSFNHYAVGSVVAWLFSRCAGIMPQEAGFKKIRLKPMPGGNFTYARGNYKCKWGNIISEWHIREGMFVLKFETPKGIPCEVIMPDGQQYHFAGGTGELSCHLTKVNE
ncbi:glycoside hydrolase family 78 protein [Lachnospiraceae bacterium OttesenSCG-928-D06]|nr:glycoside hydrolase family 78 protein [Lachnospiraceae bacterium OttesenSCG-928-D06]